MIVMIDVMLTVSLPVEKNENHRFTLLSEECCNNASFRLLQQIARKLWFKRGNCLGSYQEWIPERPETTVCHLTNGSNFSSATLFQSLNGLCWDALHIARSPIDTNHLILQAIKSAQPPGLLEWREEWLHLLGQGTWRFCRCCVQPKLQPHHHSDLNCI